jgi:hypothetical protein
MAIPTGRAALALLLATLVAAPAVAAAPCLARTENRVLAAPPVTGPLGPYRVTAVLTRPAAQENAAFDVRLRLPNGRCMKLAGTEDPNELFLFTVKQVRFAPMPRTKGNALVVLYTESQIGPMHGTDRLALVYRLSADRRGVRADRREIDGVATVPAALARLRGAR